MNTSANLSSRDKFVEHMFQALVAGDWPSVKKVLAEIESTIPSISMVISDVLWNTYELLVRMYRSDVLHAVEYGMAIQSLRTVVEQLAGELEPTSASRGTVVIFCGYGVDEVGAVMVVHLLRSVGYQVFFPGSGLATDDLLSLVNLKEADTVLACCSAASDLPGIRDMVDLLMQQEKPPKRFFAAGGVFDRNSGLAEEIGLIPVPSNPKELVDTLLSTPPSPPRAPHSGRTPGKPRRAA
jgi:methanogenic corrinoid protein MtbC1